MHVWRRESGRRDVARKCPKIRVAPKGLEYGVEELKGVVNANQGLGGFTRLSRPFQSPRLELYLVRQIGHDAELRRALSTVSLWIVSSVDWSREVRERSRKQTRHIMDRTLSHALILEHGTSSPCCGDPVNVRTFQPSKH